MDTREKDKKDRGKPEQGKIYSLTGGSDGPSISSGDSWKDSEISHEQAYGKPKASSTPKAKRPFGSATINLRTIATKGMGMETKNDIEVGAELDYYDSKIGDKHTGKVTKISSSGYEITDDKTGKKEKFTFYDKNKAQKFMENE